MAPSVATLKRSARKTIIVARILIIFMMAVHNIPIDLGTDHRMVLGLVSAHRLAYRDSLHLTHDVTGLRNLQSNYRTINEIRRELTYEAGMTRCMSDPREIYPRMRAIPA